MGHYDELDQEIDKEMGWHKGGKPKRNNKSMRHGPDYWQAILRTARAASPFWRMLTNLARQVAKVLFFPIISPLGYSKRFNVGGDMIVVKRSLAWRILDGLLTRALLAPVILAVFLIGVVFASTHPRTVHAIATPDSYGIYFKRVNIITVDNQRLTGWFIPPVTERQMALDPEGTLLQKWPAAVLCHGLGSSNDQYLLLATQLHTKGFAVLMLDTRGQGESDPAAVTYGLRERLDVLAGVKFLRENNFVDETKVCVVGHDIGATAALQAASLDSSITAVVADGLWPKFEDRARDIFSRPSSGSAWSNSAARLPTSWLAPLYTLAFEIAVRDRLNQLDPTAVVRGIHTQPVLFVARMGAEFAPIQDVSTLATNVGGHHDVFIDNPAVDGDTEDRICDFLIKSTGWNGPAHHPNEQIQDLLKHRVDK